MFGIIIAFKVYKLSPGGHGFIYNLLHSECHDILPARFHQFFLDLRNDCCRIPFQVLRKTIMKGQ